MIITRRHLDRRTMLRGAGAAIALPLLDAMVPAFAAQATTAAAPHPRLAVVYVPNGIVMADWTPATDGAGFELTPVLRPLQPFQKDLVVVTGLDSGPPSSAVHAVASTRFLTSMPPAPSGGSTVGAGISLDQVAARVIGRTTSLTSLELSLESGFAGTCDVGASCVYTDTISWRSASTPLPMEHDPRAVFERLFGEQDTTGTRRTRAGDARSILDSALDSAAALDRALGPGDRRIVAEYLEAVRQAERRIEKDEQQQARELPPIERPVGAPESFPAHARLMIDLQVLAYQADLTRVITFMMGRELSGRTYPEIGIRDAHHPLSHHRNDPRALAALTQISTHHATQLAYFLDRLRAVRDGDGSLLDHTLLLYGAGMSDGNSHSPFNLPVLLAGGAAGRLAGGRHVRVSAGTPLAALHRTLLAKLEIPPEPFGGGTEVITGL